MYPAFAEHLSNERIMLNLSTLTLLLAMVGFVALAILLVHQHNCSDIVRRKRNEFEYLSNKLKMKTDVVAADIENIQIQIDELDDQIDNSGG